MTREDIVSFQFTDEKVQSDWDEKVLGIVDELDGWISETIKKACPLEIRPLEEFGEEMRHASCRLADMNRSVQYWYDNALADAYDAWKGEKKEGNSKMIEAFVNRAVSVPKFIRTTVGDYIRASERSLTNIQASMKAEKWQPT